MQELQYHVPTSIEDAVALLRQPATRALSGGSDLIPQMREGRRSVDHVVDLKRIPELTTIERLPDGGWRIGAATSVGALGRHREFAADHSQLLASAQLIGSLQVQNRASLGGNICNAAPSADGVPLLICLNAQAEIAGPDGRRRIPVAQIATGPGRTSLAAGEVLVAIELPPKPQRSAGMYLRFTPRREMDIAIAGAAAWIALDEKSMVLDARITLASVAPVPLVAEQAQRALIGKPAGMAAFAAAAAIAAEEAKPISDARGSAEYRRELIKVLTARALSGSAEEIGFNQS